MLKQPMIEKLAAMRLLGMVEAVKTQEQDATGRELSQPGIDLLKWFRSQPVETALCVHRAFHETGLSQHSQVL